MPSLGAQFFCQIFSASRPWTVLTLARVFSDSDWKQYQGRSVPWACAASDMRTEVSIAMIFTTDMQSEAPDGGPHGSGK